MALCSSWRKASRVEQIIRVVGGAWWRRMKDRKAVLGRGDRAMGVRGRGRGRGWGCSGMFVVVCCC